MRLRHASDAWSRMSFSKLSAFQACAFRGFYEFVIGADGQDDPTGVLGQALHYHFKLFMAPHRTTGRFPFATKKALLGIFINFWRGALNSEHPFDSRRKVSPNPVAWRDAGDPSLLEKRGLAALSRFHDMYALRRLDGRTRLLERRFLFPWEGINISGVFDVVELAPKIAIVRDYKPHRYGPAILAGGQQLTMYQLAYEHAVRRHLPERPRLGRMEIYDYGKGVIQRVPFRGPQQFALLRQSLHEVREYVRGVITGSPPSAALKPLLLPFDWLDIDRGDVTPRLPQGSHCAYCRVTHLCQLWQAKRVPPAREQFRHNFEIATTDPRQQRFPFAELPVPQKHRPSHPVDQLELFPK